MNASPVFQTTLYLVVLFALAWPLSHFLAMALDGSLSQRLGWLGRSERAVCRVIGANPDEDMPWWRYALALLVFHLIGGVFVYAQQRLQGSLPLNPAHLGAVSPDSAFDTAISFLTNTNWQGYSGESTMSYLTQMLALATHNFFSAATGMAVAMALIRGFVRRKVGGVGNAWLDLYRAIMYILLPLSLVFALFLVGQGVIQNFAGYQDVKLTETVAYQVPKMGADGQQLKDAKGNPVLVEIKTNIQTLPMGPVASQEAIKMLGTNGGGFFNANSAHPYENPTPLSNFVQMLSIFLIPAALVFMFGQWVGDPRQGLTLLGAMTLLFVVMVGVEYWAEIHANPLLMHLGMDGSAGNMEGKETRFGIVASALFTVITTAASCGAVNTMHDSLMPLGGLAPMWLIKLGEVVFGGVGAGLYGMLIYAILAVFLSGLMIGRTPEYLGKKIESFEMKMVAIAILVTPCLILGGTALSVMLDVGKAGMANPGAHGFSEVLYAFASAANNNGSAFAGLNANTPYYNIMLALVMWFGRFSVIIPVLAIAGKLAAKPRLTATAGTLPTHGPLFVLLLVGTVVIVGALTYIPALALGPVVEHLQLFGH